MSDALAVEFVGNRRKLLGLAFRTSLWTLLTLGFYRFWMKTRLRRYYWSSVRPGGVPLEYLGDPLEKLLGFLIAVVILAFYLGVVNLLLVFGSFSLLASNWAAYVLSFVGVIPIWFYARYRARRYVLARTRWRGIRFGMDKGAVGYAARALGYWVLTILSLGTLWPLMTFRLEKFRIDRTFYGDQRFEQGGDWTMLYPAFAHVLIGGFLTLGAVLQLRAGEDGFAALLFLSLPWLLLGIVHYRVRSIALMACEKRIGGTRLFAAPETGPIARAYGFGTLATALVALIPLFVIVTAYNISLAARYSGGGAADLLGTIPVWVFTGIGILAYFFMFLTWAVLQHAYVTQPIWRHLSQSVTLQGAMALANVRQRDRDDLRQAEGFAEALDVGAAL